MDQDQEVEVLDMPPKGPTTKAVVVEDLPDTPPEPDSSPDSTDDVFKSPMKRMKSSLSQPPAIPRKRKVTKLNPLATRRVCLRAQVGSPTTTPLTLVVSTSVVPQPPYAHTLLPIIRIHTGSHLITVFR